MRHYKPILFSLIVLGLSPIVNAATPSAYRIEVLIFSQLSKQGLSQENWPVISSPPIISSRAIPFNTPAQGNLVYHLLSNRYFSMQSIEKRLSNNPNYQVLMHFVWQQSRRNLSRQKVFNIIGGQGYSSSGQLSNILLTSPTPDQLNQSAVWQVNGTISISVNRYFNMGFNLQFAEPTNTLQQILPSWNANNQYGPISYFNLIQNRRLKSKELNYIDSPLYGVLVKIAPVS